jgi:UDP-N-acetylmuramate--alanine ligase
MLGRTRRIHFVGIGGIGMSGIAELLANQGYAVSGSDARGVDVTRRLETLGVRVVTGHAAEHVGDATWSWCRRRCARPTPRSWRARPRHPGDPAAEMLAELMRLKQGIAVAGAHGKTTTTSMVALLLDRAGLDPTAVIGGKLSAFGSNARLGQGSYLVAEADESDGSFLSLSPVVSIVTNVDREHLDHYGSFEGVLDAFVAFANKVPFWGVGHRLRRRRDAAWACAAHHPPRRHLRHRHRRRSPREGVGSRRSDRAAASSSAAASWARCGCRCPGRPQPAERAVRRGRRPRAGCASSDRLGAGRVPRRRPAASSASAEAEGVLVVDDYGPPPDRDRRRSSPPRGRPRRRLVVVFSRTCYSRTERLLPEFGETLARADVVVLCDIYPAGEDPASPPGVTVDAVPAAVQRPRTRRLVMSGAPRRGTPAPSPALATPV